MLSLAQLLSVQTKRSFVLGASFEDATAEDLMFVGEGPVDIEQLRVRLGGDAHARHEDRGVAARGVMVQRRA